MSTKQHALAWGTWVSLKPAPRYRDVHGAEAGPGTRPHMVLHAMHAMAQVKSNTPW